MADISITYASLAANGLALNAVERVILLDGNQKSGTLTPLKVGSLSHYLQGLLHPNGLALRFLNYQQYQPRSNFLGERGAIKIFKIL